MFALLEDAVFCFQEFLLASDRKRAETYRAAKHWIFEADDDWLFSFENICEALGWSPEHIRQGLKRWKTRKLAGRNRIRLSRLRARTRAQLSGVSSRVTMRGGFL
ncbi:MAG: hypothetical protein A3F90_09300 [Deltaproteobacteria bacterium RIFCSPLOWO2_12_FULL_60_19]|nr:MAG: hypothetical protein A3F90_09300 [Deltaproteobacteria bacterium RIFCSPLOWO2_12_FULL_60_19]